MARKPALRHRPTKPESGDLRDYLHEVNFIGRGRRPTAEHIARALDLSLNRTQTVIKEGLTPEDVLTLAEFYSLNPVSTLVDFGFISMEDVYKAATTEIPAEKPQAFKSRYKISGEKLQEILEQNSNKNITITIDTGEEA